MNDKIQELKDLIEEYDNLINELDDMSDTWECRDECDRAENDPGLQFGKEMELEIKFDEIKKFCNNF